MHINSVFFPKGAIKSSQTKQRKKKNDTSKKNAERLHTATPLLAASSASSSLWKVSIIPSSEILAPSVVAASCPS